MPFRRHVFGSFLATGIFLATGCVAGADNTITAEIGTEFQLRVGQSALVSAANIEIGFAAVAADSRCGKGEVCVWEGDAIVRIWLQRAGGAREEHELHTNSREANSAIYAGYSIRLVTLNPPSVSGRSIAPAEYVATLQVTRGLSGNENIL